VIERALVGEDLVLPEEECPAVDVLDFVPEEVLVTVTPSELVELSRDEGLVVREGVEEPEVELKHEVVALDEGMGDIKR